MTTQTNPSSSTADAGGDPAALAATQGAGDGRGYTPDPDLPDVSDQLLDAFGLEGDWADAMRGVETRLSNGAQGGDANGSVSGGQGGEGSSPAATPAAEGVPGAPSPAPAAPAAPAPAASPLPPQSPPAPAAGQGSDVAGTPPADLAARVQQLEAQNQALQHMLSQQQQGQGTQPPAAQPGQGGSAQPADTSPTPTPEQLQDYRFAIPADVMQAIDSDDPGQRTAGLTHLVNSFSKIVHQRAIAHAEQIIDQRVQQALGQYQVTQEQRNMMNDYYSAFPDHNDPLNRLVVAQVAQEMWTANPQLQWSEATRDALGARVNEKLGRAAAPQAGQGQGQQQDPAPASPAPAPMPRPAASTGATNRPANSSAPTPGEQITEILGSL